MNTKAKCILWWLSFWYVVAIASTVWYVLQAQEENTQKLSLKYDSTQGVDGKMPRPPEPDKTPMTAKEIKAAETEKKVELGTIPLRLLVPMVIVLGALGAVVSSTIAFVNEPTYDFPVRRACWYWFAPFKGAVVASFVFIALRAGVLTLTGQGSEGVFNPNVYMFAAIGAGLFADAAYRKLGTVSTSLLGFDKIDAEYNQLTPRRKRISISEARSDDGGLREVFRFRYDILVARAQWEFEGRSLHGNMVNDEYDEFAYVWMASLHDDDQLCGSLRSIVWDRLPANFLVTTGNGLSVPKVFDEILSQRNTLLPDLLAGVRCSFTSRLVVSRRNAVGRYCPSVDDFDLKPIEDDEKAERHSVATALCTHAFCHGLHLGVRVDWIIAVTAERPFFERLGYRIFEAGLKNPDIKGDSGPAKVDLMYLVLEDTSYLRSVGSKFHHYERWDTDHEAGEELSKAIQTYLREANRKQA